MDLLIRCPRCREVFDKKDEVIMDYLFSIYHLDCSHENIMSIKDYGFFLDIVLKHGLFDESLLIH